jgi:sugar lactone lactonase YvrE
MVNRLEQQLPTIERYGTLEPVALFEGPMPTGVTVSHQGRIFVNFPKWGDRVTYSVAEICNGRPVAYPDLEFNRADPHDLVGTLVSVQSVVVDPLDRLWILDTGSPNFAPTQFGGPKLVCIDLKTDRLVKSILLPQDVALPTTYLNDIRFDLGRSSEGMAFITDSSSTGPNGIIVVELASGQSWRKLHAHPSTKAEPIENFLPIVEGKPLMERPANGKAKPISMGVDGIAIGADGSRLYYCPLMSRRLYSVSIDALVNRTLDDRAVAETIVDEGDKGGGADGLESDAAGYIYATNYEHQSIVRRAPRGHWETVVHNPLLMWPDTLSIAADGYLYVIANQLHRQARYQLGRDLRIKPYTLFRIRIDAKPVLLR